MLILYRTDWRGGSSLLNLVLSFYLAAFLRKMHVPGGFTVKGMHLI